MPKDPGKQAEKQAEKQTDKLPEKLVSADKTGDKNPKFEKLEKYEHKEKPEKIEHKEKLEKFEHKEKFEKHEKFEKIEKNEHKDKFEKVEAEFIPQPVEIPDPARQSEGTVEERLARVEQILFQLSHFIGADLRPDLSRGALKQEATSKGSGGLKKEG